MSGISTSTLRSIGYEIVDIAKSPSAWIVVLGGAYVLVYFLSGEAKTNLARTEAAAALEQSIKRTDAGTFALGSVEECLGTGWSWLGTKPTTSVCISQTIEAATKLRGEGFGNEVREALARKFAPSTAP